MAAPLFVLIDFRAVADRSERVKNPFGRFRIAVDFAAERFDVDGRIAGAARVEEHAKESDAREEVVAALVAVGVAPREKERNRRGDGGPRKHEEPRDVEPQQEDGKRHEGAVDVRKRSRRHVGFKTALDDLSHDRDRKPPDERVLGGHAAVRDELVENGVAEALQEHLSPEVEGVEKARRLDPAHGDFDRLLRHGERQKDRRRREREHPPVDERALRPGAQTPHLEDAVDRDEELVDQKERRHGQARQTEDP